VSGSGMPNCAEVLKAAAALLRGGWCRHTYAVDARGDEVDPCDDHAAAFCALGALRRASFDLHGRPAGVPMRARSQCLAHAAGRELSAKIDGGDDYENAITVWNDDARRTAAEVQAAFAEALRVAELQR
jgi:hypothetical protein